MERTIVGIERPKVRNGCSIRTLNTLTYIIINMQALQSARALTARTTRAVFMLC